MSSCCVGSACIDIQHGRPTYTYLHTAYENLYYAAII